MHFVAVVLGREETDDVDVEALRAEYFTRVIPREVCSVEIDRNDCSNVVESTNTRHDDS